jgi:hypothetical protein
MRKCFAVLTFCALLSLSSLAQAAHSVTLTWSAGSGGGVASSYDVQRSATHGGPYTTIGNTPGTSLVDSSTAVQNEGATFFYVVIAKNAAGSSAPSNEVTLTIPTSAPVPPVLAAPVVK